ncbi:MAG: NAD(P)H-binding protein [Gammaproteobacteria bacterium]|nr:NAD(P)H-binding protein [Gammaproteobacteria bacterium]
MPTDCADIPVLIFGATGGTGVALVQDAVNRGYAVSAFCRTPEKARHKLGDTLAKVNLVQGDAGNEDDVERAFATRPEAIILSLGIYQSKAGLNELTGVTELILAAMHRHQVRRAINISSLGVGESWQQGNFLARLIQRTTLKHTIADKNQQEQLLNNSGLDVTHVRPSRLTNGSGPSSYCTWEGAMPDRKLVWAVNRSDVAEFALQCLGDPNTAGKSFVITGSKDS